MLVWLKERGKENFKKGGDILMRTSRKGMLVMMVAGILAGCASAPRVSGERVVALDAPLTSIGVCLGAETFSGKDRSTDLPDERMARQQGTRTGNNQINEVFPALSVRIPAAFEAVGVRSTVAFCAGRGVSVPTELDGYAEVLRITPNKLLCMGTGCNTWWDVEAYRRGDGVIFWRGEIGWTAAHLAKLDAKFADQLAQKLLVQLQQDGVLPRSAGRRPAKPVTTSSQVSSAKVQSAADHAGPLPPSSGFAPVDDVDAVPKLGAKGRELYREWLTKPFPRAVAVSEKGAMARGYGVNAMQQAVQNCEKLFGNPCRLYAVDDQVVWKSE